MSSVLCGCGEATFSRETAVQLFEASPQFGNDNANLLLKDNAERQGEALGWWEPRVGATPLLSPIVVASSGGLPTLASVFPRSLFRDFCAQCHGEDARGRKGIPNLTDDDWLWGGDESTIVTTILEGRTGVMPPFETVLGGQEAEEVAHYVLSLSSSAHDARLAVAGNRRYDRICIACHGPHATGNRALGAPNLTDNIWLHGGTISDVIETISKGRNNTMPSHRSLLTKKQGQLLARYVLRLGNQKHQQR
jgi:cbb3-type cytochrome c oxidase subunit III